MAIIIRQIMLFLIQPDKKIMVSYKWPMYIFLYASFFIKDLKQNKELFENNQPEKPSED